MRERYRYQLARDRYRYLLCPPPPPIHRISFPFHSLSLSPSLSLPTPHVLSLLSPPPPPPPIAVSVCVRQNAACSLTPGLRHRTCREERGKVGPASIITLWILAAAAVVLLSVLGCRLTYQGQAEANARACFSVALRPWKP